MKPIAASSHPPRPISPSAIGAAMKVPIEPAAATVPRIIERLTGEITLAVAASPILSAVQASPTPTIKPSPTISSTGPVAARVSASPPANRKVPSTVTIRQPKRSAIPPINGWLRPQTRFWIPSASVTSATDTSMLFGIGSTNRPKLWRIPIDSVSMMLAAVSTVMVWEWV